jgi:hypothetical protein
MRARVGGVKDAFRLVGDSAIPGRWWVEQDMLSLLQQLGLAPAPDA